MIVSYDLKLGLLVKDNVSGLEGVLVAYALKPNSVKQYVIQPKSATGTDKPESWFVDIIDVVEKQEKEVDSYKLNLDSPTEVKFRFNIFDKVKDTTTGIKGVISTCLYWKNGCVRYYVQPKAKKNATKVPEPFSCDEIELVGLEPEQKEYVHGETGPGGPSTMLKSERVK